MRTRFRDQSWIHPYVKLEKSRISGNGLFAAESLEKFTIVIVWGGRIISSREREDGQGVKNTMVAIGDGWWLTATDQHHKSLDDYMNHSCDPNVGMLNELTLITMRRINKGEELTADYCIWLDDEEYQMGVACNCGSGNCRTIIRGSDWLLPEVQKRLLPFFSPFLKERLEPK